MPKKTSNDRELKSLSERVKDLETRRRLEAAEAKAERERRDEIYRDQLAKSTPFGGAERGKSVTSYFD